MPNGERQGHEVFSKSLKKSLEIIALKEITILPR
jgi:hypothetical protein